MLALILENRVLILTVMLGVSEALALIPSLSANGILDGIIKVLKALRGSPQA